MKLKLECDAAIVCSYLGIAIFFARIPDAEVAREIYSLVDQSGIDIDILMQVRRGEIVSSGNSIKQQRLYYWIDIPPVFNTLEVGKQIAACFRDDHGLNVRLYDEYPNNGLRKSIPVGKSNP